jgi:hypothetical protein
VQCHLESWLAQRREVDPDHDPVPLVRGARFSPLSRLRTIMPWFRARNYTLYRGDAPGETAGEAVASPSSLAVVIVRVEVKDKTNPKYVAAAQDIFNRISIKGNRSAEFPALDLLSGFDGAVAAERSRRMDEALAAVSFTDTVVGPGQELGVNVPILNHSAGTKGGWGGPDPAHSAYEIILLDKNGDSMVGGNGTYTATTKEPPVDAFWSLTVYDTSEAGVTEYRGPQKLEPEIGIAS